MCTLQILTHTSTLDLEASLSEELAEADKRREFLALPAATHNVLLTAEADRG